MAIIRLALASLWNRRTTAGLTVLALALSVMMLLGVEKLRRDAREAFTNTLSGTDLIVGARGGSTQLLLYSVFRIGDATSNVSWRSYQELSAHRRVRWSVPLSLGDSHRGYRVLGTTRDYFQHYRYGGGQALRFEDGEPFAEVLDAVLGSEVARRLGYRVGNPIVVAHGAGEVALTEHDDKPFEVVGILAPTGTPVDRTVHVSLQGIEAIHVGWEAGAPPRGGALSALGAPPQDLTPKTITAFLLGLDSKIAIFSMQRDINAYRREPLQAIIPGVALTQLWEFIGAAENALLAISLMVVVTGLLGMLVLILASLEARRREMAVLRSVGARPTHVFALFMSEAGLLACAGAALGVALLYAALAAARPVAANLLGLRLPLTGLSPHEWMILGAVVGAAILAGAIPAVRAYRRALSDGLSVNL